MSNLVGGRTNQKRRTHVALVECAAEFVREGKGFTVAEVADRAQVGRTTAYRYFPSVDVLIAHATLYATTEVEKKTIGAGLESKKTPEDRLRSVIEASDTSIVDHDFLYRTMLRLTLSVDNVHEGVPLRRSGARKELLEAAVGALRSQLGEKRYERLTAALSLFLGIEAAVVLGDVCLLTPEKAREVKVWGAQAILAAALAEASESGKRSKGPKPPAATKKITPLKISSKR